MKATKDEVTLTTPIYFIDGKQVCYLDTQTKCRFFEASDGLWGTDCRLHGKDIYINIKGHRIPTESCLLAKLYKDKRNQEQIS